MGRTSLYYLSLMVGMTSVQFSWMGHRGSKLILTVMLGELLSISFLFFSYELLYYII